jgi:hypothetical protein
VSFSVSVFQAHESRPIDFDSASSAEVDSWIEYEHSFELFGAFIASDDFFYYWYASVASELGLPLLTGACQNGLALAAAEDLSQLLKEIAAVEDQ